MELLAFLFCELEFLNLKSVNSSSENAERIADDEPRKSGLKSKGLFFQEKEKRLSESEYQ
jgi:hypothetical protein